MLLVWRDREEDTIAVDNTSSKLHMIHEPSNLLRARQMRRQEILRYSHLLLKWGKAFRLV